MDKARKTQQVGIKLLFIIVYIFTPPKAFSQPEQVPGGLELSVAYPDAKFNGVSKFISAYALAANGIKADPGTVLSIINTIAKLGGGLRGPVTLSANDKYLLFEANQLSGLIVDGFYSFKIPLIDIISLTPNGYSIWKSTATVDVVTRNGTFTILCGPKYGINFFDFGDKELAEFVGKLVEKAKARQKKYAKPTGPKNKDLQK